MRRKPHATYEQAITRPAERNHEFIAHIMGRYPVRLHRMRSDARWLRKKAEKFGANPDKIMGSLR